MTRRMDMDRLEDYVYLRCFGLSINATARHMRIHPRQATRYERRWKQTDLTWPPRDEDTPPLPAPVPITGHGKAHRMIPQPQACPSPSCWPPEPTWPLEVHGTVARFTHGCGEEWWSDVSGWFPVEQAGLAERAEAA